MSNFPEVLVSGFDMTAINAAKATAGPYGTLDFPDGAYAIDALTADQPNQKWRFSSGAVLTRTATSTTSVLTLMANVEIEGGVFDGNVSNNPNGCDGVDSTGFSLKATGMTLQNVKDWGFAIDNAPMQLFNCHMSNILLGDVIWRNTTMTGMIAPTIDSCIIDKSMIPLANLTTGSIYVQSLNTNNYQLSYYPRVTRNQIIQPSVQNSNIVGMEIKNCQRGFVGENVITGGGNGVSNAQSGYMRIRDNVFQSCGTYSIELGGNDNLVTGNMGSGLGPSMYGIFINPVVTSSAVMHNHFYTGFTNGGIYNGAPSGCVMANNF